VPLTTRRDLVRGRESLGEAELSDSQDADLGLIDVLSRASTVVQAHIATARLREQPPGYLISVPVHTIGLFDFHRTAEATAAGHAAARQALPGLIAALAAAAPLSQRISRWLDLSLKSVIPELFSAVERR
jgi:predicted acylesterase/phospholipase RssA